MIQLFFLFSDFGLLFFRIVLGIILFGHGLPKAKNFKATVSGFNELKIKPAKFWAVIVTALELVSGILLMLGFLTQIISLLVMIEFLVIILLVKRKSKLINGYEFELLILVSALLLATLGAGYYSLDNILNFWIY
ncbi:MAG: DoxX family protein [Minisyncoccia bacterium]